MPDELKTTPPEARTKLLSNGAVYDLDAKRIVKGSSPDYLGTLRDRRRELAAKEARYGMVRAVTGASAIKGIGGRTEANTPAKAWGVIVEMQADLAQAIEQTRASTEAAKFVGRAAGLISDGSERAQAGTQIAVVLQLAPGTLSYLERTLAEDE